MARAGIEGLRTPDFDRRAEQLTLAVYGYTRRDFGFDAEEITPVLMGHAGVESNFGDPRFVFTNKGEAGVWNLSRSEMRRAGVTPSRMPVTREMAVNWRLGAQVDAVLEIYREAMHLGYLDELVEAEQTLYSDIVGYMAFSDGQGWLERLALDLHARGLRPKSLDLIVAVLRLEGSPATVRANLPSRMRRLVAYALRASIVLDRQR